MNQFYDFKFMIVKIRVNTAQIEILPNWIYATILIEIFIFDRNFYFWSKILFLVENFIFYA